jgi:hypothetical protein
MTRDPKTPQVEKTVHTLAGGSDFPTTRWTLVIAAADPRRTEARSALVSLCEAYWYPLYAYIRRRGYAADQAQDLAQDFFVRVLEGRYLDRADPDKGRFRAFILTSLKFFWPTKAIGIARRNAAAEPSCPSKSRPARSVINASLRTTRRQSGSSTGAGRFRCSTESSIDSGPSSSSMDAWIISTG